MRNDITRVAVVAIVPEVVQKEVFLSPKEERRGEERKGGSREAPRRQWCAGRSRLRSTSYFETKNEVLRI